MITSYCLTTPCLYTKDTKKQPENLEMSTIINDICASGRIMKTFLKNPDASGKIFKDKENMAKQVKIKDIAKMAGVSAGTVDRILHNRGNVSQASREAGERVLSEVGDRYNIHTSAISLRREYRIIITMPTASPGEYWGTMQEGIKHALHEYCDISIDCNYAFYNQFDVYSCRSAFESIPDSAPDAVIIGPTFTEETVSLCSRLDSRKIPYIFVDAAIEGTSPIATFTTDQYACGELLGHILHSITPAGSGFAIFRNQRIGNRSSNNSVERKKGFMNYCRKNGAGQQIHETSFSVMTPEDNEKSVIGFVEKHPDIRGIAVLNSRGYIIADILNRHSLDHIKMVSFDLTSNNVRGIRDGSIEALLCQRPGLQGFLAVKTVIRYLLYNRTDLPLHTLMPIDIVMKQNLDFYREFTEL